MDLEYSEAIWFSDTTLRVGPITNGYQNNTETTIEATV